MPLPNISDRRAYLLDTVLELRDITDGEETTTASETGVPFAVRKMDRAVVVVNHNAIGGTVDGSNYWNVSVEISDAVGGTYTEIASTGALAAAAATIELPISGANAAYVDADSAYIRVTATETGSTAGNLTYGAYVS